MSFQNLMTYFLLWNRKEDILINVFVHTMEGILNSLVTNILQNIFFYVQQKK